MEGVRIVRAAEERRDREADLGDRIEFRYENWSV